LENNLDTDFHKRVIDFIKNTDHILFTTHTKVCYSIIERIHRRVLDGYGIKFGPIKVDQKTNLIVDGNHRYISILRLFHGIKTIAIHVTLSMIL